MSNIIKPQDTPEEFDIMSDKMNEASGILKAMANDTRLTILCALSDGELSVNQLVVYTGQSPSGVSQHLAKLKAAGLVEARREAQTIYYNCTSGLARSVVNTLCGYYKSDNA